MTDKEIAEIGERAGKATPGEWHLKKDGRYEDHDECRIEMPDDNIELCRYENGDFIAHAREDVPALLAEVERLWAENDDLKRIIFDIYGIAESEKFEEITDYLDERLSTKNE